MPTHSIGDRVVCQIRNNHIVSRYDTEYDERLVFDIISFYEEGYFIYVPKDLHIADAILISRSNYKHFRIPKKFIGDEVFHISDHKIVEVHSKIDGMFCSNCGEFVSMAGPNQSDKSTFICYPCRINKFR
jgi:hypothetical protein